MRIKSQYIVYIISFFLYSGYYAGLSLIFASGAAAMSRFYSVPLRIILCVLMLVFIKQNFHKIKQNIGSVFLVSLFSMLYILKVLYTESLDWNTRNSWFLTIFYYLSYCILPFLFFSGVDVKKYKNEILNAMIFSGFVLSVLSIFVYRGVLASGGIARISHLTYETGESVISPLALAYSSIITISLCLYKLTFERTKYYGKIFAVITIVLSFVLFFLGSTRGALVALLLSLLLLVYFGNIKRKLLMIVLIIISTPLVIWGIEATGSSLLVRTTNTLEEGDMSGRMGLWKGAINEYLNNPIVGGRIEVSGIYPHNIFLEILMATGTVGFLLFFIFFIRLFYKGMVLAKESKEIIIPLLIFICGISLHNFSGSIYSAITVFAALGMFNSNHKN